ncbi:hypothetical protein D4L85_32035 [Chryseolinea soli]|uniref:Uncharacterized protein n=1 Tax=Chryseolinea soli TaxID=2321403 RepID=A0A385SUP1_9BACT|nr:hypothetical protein D4L85_32035 [Chryseolinea soli]
MQKDGQKIKPFIFADEMLISGVEWKKLTFLAGCKALTLSDFGEYFYNLGITEGKLGTESCAKNGSGSSSEPLGKDPTGYSR